MIKCSNQKTYTVAEWIRKDPYICCLQETYFRWKDKVKEWKKDVS